jgi:KRAB domain-containing zinc finger protein
MTRTRDLLRRHLSAVHGTTLDGTKKACYHACDVCDFKTLKISLLRTHLTSCAAREGRVVEDASLKKKKTYSCSFCSYACGESSDLKKHERARHKGEKPYACDVCPYKAATQSVLLRHVRSHEKVRRLFF